VVQHVRGWHAPADAVVARDGDVDPRRVDTAQLIELQRRPAALDLPALGHAHKGHRVDSQLPRVPNILAADIAQS
jgi:hypothetical protein